MEKEVTKGYRYAVTAHEDGVTVTDVNGLNLACPAGVQTYFVATGDTVDVTGDATLTQARGGIITGGNGSGEKIAAGEVVIGGTQGSITIQDVNTAKQLWPGTFGSLTELPEGVTFEALESSVAPPITSTGSLAQIFQQLMTYGRTTPVGAVAMVTLFGGSSLTRLPSTVNFAALKDGSYMFSQSNLESFASDMPSLTRGYNMLSACKQLTSFKGNAPLLTTTTAMFSACSKLAHWEGSFGASLVAASNMFNGCVLDLDSIQNLTSALPSISGGSITIGVDSAKVSQAQQDAANTIIVGKGWTVTWQRN